MVLLVDATLFSNTQTPSPNEKPAMKNKNPKTAKRGTPQSPTTSCLVKQAQAGDRGAFGTLYERYTRYVQSIALRILRDEGEAEEVCHDVFIQAMEKLDQIKNPA